jgi:putative CocE/NonD family hydrolase
MLDVYTGAVTEGDPAIRKEQYLFVEPLGHCESESTSFRYPNYTITDYFETSLAIFRNDWSDPVFDRIDYINIYVLGQVPAFVPKGTSILGNYWASLPAWPQQTLTNYYLNADSKALTTTAPTTSASLTYTYDPKDPVTTYGGNNLLVTPCGPQDQSKIEARSDVLSFTGPPLTAPLALCGKVTAQIYVSSDQVDTDFYVSLTDVYPDGQSVLVRYGAIRMRWRDSANVTSLMTPGKTYGVSVNMWSTAYIYDTNHKIRVTVTSSNSPQFTVNPNNGHLLADPSQPVYVAKNTLYTSASTPSYVTLPIVKLSDLPQNPNIL